MIFFWSSCFFAVGRGLQLVLHIFYPARSSGPAVLLTTGYFGLIMFGLLLFTFGIVSLFVEVCGIKHKIDEFGRRLFASRLAANRIAVPRTGVPPKDLSA
jgi:hypothetical protein